MSEFDPDLERETSVDSPASFLRSARDFIAAIGVTVLASVALGNMPHSPISALSHLLQAYLDPELSGEIAAGLTVLLVFVPIWMVARLVLKRLNIDLR